MPYSLTVTAVQPNPKDWGNTYGQFKDYTVTVSNDQSGNTRDVSWSRKVKPDGTCPVPQVGDQIEAEMTQQTRAPGWKLSQVNFVGTTAGISGISGYSSSTNGGGAATQDLRRSKETMLIQESDASAAILMLANAATGNGWTWEQFEDASAKLQARAGGTAPATEPASFRLPEKRRDSEPTGESDVPSPAQGEFVHAGSDKPDDDIPF